MLRILNLGAGWQSTALLLMSCRGDLPKLDAAVFADTQYEPPAVYDHLDWLKGESARHGIPVHVVTAGNLRDDALRFRSHRASEDGKRFASIPVFVANPDGSQGILPRQCTKEYKIGPCELFVRSNILGLAKGQRAPKEAIVESWFGISSDEGQRASHPGCMQSKKKKIKTLFGHDVIRVRQWHGLPWKHHVYPLLNLRLLPNRTSKNETFLPQTMTRDDVGAWLRRHYPERKVPRSACICCPFRSNLEWREMRDHDAASFADAVEFDRQMRESDALGLSLQRKPLTGKIFLHRDLVPLDMVDLDKGGYQGESGCGSLGDGMDGMCDV